MQTETSQSLQQDLDYILSSIQSEHQIIQQASHNKNGIHYIIMGPSGVGKTTLAALLCNLPLISNSNEEGDLVYNRQQQQEEQPPLYPNAQISNNRIKSQTKTPYSLQYPSSQKDEQIFLWDTPGYEGKKPGES